MAAGLLIFALLPIPATMLRAMRARFPATIGGLTFFSWTPMWKRCLTVVPAGSCRAKMTERFGRATTRVPIPTHLETLISNLPGSLWDGIWLRQKEDRDRKCGLTGRNESRACGSDNAQRFFPSLNK